MLKNFWPQAGYMHGFNSRARIWSARFGSLLVGVLIGAPWLWLGRWLDLVFNLFPAIFLALVGLCPTFKGTTNTTSWCMTLAAEPFPAGFA